MKLTPFCFSPRLCFVLALALVLSIWPAHGQVTQIAELIASDGGANDWFGNSVAISGNTVVVGAPFADGDHPTTGAAYVFSSQGNGWTQIAKLAASDGHAYDEFGAVAISGNTIAVGSQDNAFDAGAVYVFVEPAGGWTNMTETAKLTVSGLGAGGRLGSSVAISADATRVVAAAYGCCGFIFERPAAGWVNQSKPTVTLEGSGGAFNAIAISGDAVVLGSDSGVAYVYVSSTEPGPINPSATLTGSDKACSTLGVSVAMSGNTIAAGAIASAPGTVCIFVRPTSGWADMTQTAELSVSTSQPIEVGSSVGISGKWVVTGARDAYIGKNSSGEFLGYARAVGGWVNTTVPNLSRTSWDGMNDDWFGQAIAVAGNTLVVGAPLHAVDGNSQQGAAYIFGPNP